MRHYLLEAPNGALICTITATSRQRARTLAEKTLALPTRSTATWSAPHRSRRSTLHVVSRAVAPRDVAVLIDCTGRTQAGPID